MSVKENISIDQIAEKEEYPNIYTRSHFEMKDGEVVLKNRYSPSDYEMKGNWEEFRKAKHICIWFHGMDTSESAAINEARTTLRAFHKNGVDNIFVPLYSYDCYRPEENGTRVTQYSRKNGSKLAQWIKDYRNEDQKIHLLGYSLGAHAVFEAIQLFHSNGSESMIDTVCVMGVGADDNVTQIDGRYGEAIGSVVGDFYNIYNEQDSVLQYIESVVGWRNAIGKSGVRDIDKTPPNYSEIDVTDKSVDHYTYNEPNRGVIEEITQVIDFN